MIGWLLRGAGHDDWIFDALGHTDNCHTNLFTQEELDKALYILKLSELILVNDNQQSFNSALSCM
jgi:hypothetical protein